ncbi:MAG: hypothetical protein V3G42_00425 [Oscillospiraceae bacterium]
MSDGKEISICDECGSEFYKETSDMMGLCPECAHILYGYPNCGHVFQNGRCVKCYWNGKESEYIHMLKIKQTGTLILDGQEFHLLDSENTRLNFFESDEEEGTLIISLDLEFERKLFQLKEDEGESEPEEVSPQIIINEHETGKSSIDEIIGDDYEVESVEEAEEREDLFYVYEHEPFINYTLSVVEKEGEMVHIKIEGKAIADGYSRPEKIADFSGDFWLRYKTD